MHWTKRPPIEDKTGLTTLIIKTHRPWFTDDRLDSCFSYSSFTPDHLMVLKRPDNKRTFASHWSVRVNTRGAWQSPLISPRRVWPPDSALSFWTQLRPWSRQLFICSDLVRKAEVTVMCDVLTVWEFRTLSYPHCMLWCQNQALTLSS